VVVLKVLHKAIGLAVMMAFFCVGPTVFAKTILYVPQDNRPVDYAYTIETARDAGYTMIVPPTDLLSGRSFQGSPEQLMQWVDDNAAQADAIVLSTDSLIYGGLVDSRKHNLDMETMVRRLKHIESLKEKYGSIPIYAFSTVMRSPWAGGNGVEPDYYMTYGRDIFELSALQNKMDSEGLNPKERGDWFSIIKRVPVEYLQDWFNRRHKNMMINHMLIQDAKKGIFKYFSLGHDDNSIYSQSALEAKYLDMDEKGVSDKVYGSFPGADQLGLLLIVRAHNDFNNFKPKVTVIYPLGGEDKTVPSYDGQEIGKTIKAHVLAVGGVITNKEKPDLVLAVNTPLSTETTESSAFENFPIMLNSTKKFLGQIENTVNAGIPVSIVDMAFSNGSDNTLVYGLYQHKMMYRLAAYNGWNTASNSVGYGISQGLLAKDMSDQQHRKMLTIQYLDNWAYQANVRDYITRLSVKLQAGEETRCYPTQIAELQSRTKEQLQRYAQQYLEVDPRTVDVTLPWNRLFEVYVSVHDTPDVMLEAVVRNRIKLREQARVAKSKADQAAQAVKDAQMKAQNGNLTAEQKAAADAAVQKAMQAAARQAAEAAAASQVAESSQNQEEVSAQQNRTWVPTT
jgi:hypothetical protein